MSKIMVLLKIVAFMALASYAHGYDNEITHKDITKRSVPFSKFDYYLKQNLGASNGFQEIVRGKQVIDWLKEVSYEKVFPNCRASNHFHNPLLPWNQSYMTDQPMWLDAICSDWKPLYSNVTWATGYMSPAPVGQKVSFSNYSSNFPINWDKKDIL